jgi:hypothetical protein
MFSVFYNQTLTDIEVCYKMFTKEILKQLVPASNDFGSKLKSAHRSPWLGAGGSMKSADL